ncbi:hypothetical protein E0F72_10975 [Streptococcus dysgalactiae]|nr:hypothetical protein E0F72_10975 [Streptococcus dysgalactiae]
MSFLPSFSLFFSFPSFSFFFSFSPLPPPSPPSLSPPLSLFPPSPSFSSLLLPTCSSLMKQEFSSSYDSLSLPSAFDKA